MKFFAGLGLIVGFSQAGHAHRNSDKSVSYSLPPATCPQAATVNLSCALTEILYWIESIYASSFGFLFSKSQVQCTVHIALHLFT